MIKIKSWKLLIIALCLWISPNSSFATTDSQIKSYYISADIALRRMELGTAMQFLDKLTKNQTLRKIEKPQRQKIAEIASRAYLMAGEYKKTIGLKRYYDSYGLPQALVSLQAIEQEKWRDALHSLDIMSASEDNPIWKQWILPLVRVWALAGEGKSGQAFSHFEALQQQEGLTDILPLQEILLHLHLRQPQAVLKKLGNPDTLSPIFLAYYLQALAMADRSDEAVELLSRVEDDGNKILSEVRHALENDISIEAVLTPPSQALSYLFLHLAEILLSDHPREALLYARLASYIGEDNFEVSYIIADVLSRFGDYVGAIEIWQDFEASDDEQEILSVMQMSDYLFQLERYDSAEDLLLGLRRRFSDDISLRETLGYHYLRLDDYGSVISFYAGEDLLEEVSHWRGFYLRGIAYERLGMWELAEADLLRASDLAPNNPHVLNYLGYSWIDRGENLQDGFRLLMRAVDLRSDDGAIMDSLGWAYYRLGDYSSSVAYLERAVALSPNEAVILDHLGDAYWQVGRELEASFQWRRALRVSGIEDDLRAKILQKLEDRD